MKFLQLSKLAFAPVAVLLLFPQTKAQAGGEGFSKNALSDSKGTVSSDVGLGKFEANPWHISVSVRNGYDDNVNLSSFDERDSFFTNGALGLTYNAGNNRTKISLNAGVSATYYWDDGDGDDDSDFGDFDGDTDDFAINAWLGFNLTHRATPRLTLTAQVQAAYLTRPGFDTFNANFFAVERRNQNFFQTVNRFGVGYQWAPRFATLTHYTLGYVDYEDDIISFFEDRFEHTIGNEFRFLLAPTTTVVGEYRLGIVDYVDDNDRNSHSHFFLAGVDHSFSPRFNVSARAGVEVRNFDFDDDDIFDDDDDDTHVAPYFEGTLNYAIGQNTSLTWFNRYSFEQPNIPDALIRETYRTSLSLRHNFTARISAGLNFAYQHDSYEESGGALVGFDEDAFDIALTARYAMNRNWGFEVGYQHTEVMSDANVFRDFDRNQYWVGATFTW